MPAALPYNHLHMLGRGGQGVLHGLAGVTAEARGGKGRSVLGERAGMGEGRARQATSKSLPGSWRRTQRRLLRCTVRRELPAFLQCSKRLLQPRDPSTTAATGGYGGGAGVSTHTAASLTDAAASFALSTTVSTAEPSCTRGIGAAACLVWSAARDHHTCTANFGKPAIPHMRCPFPTLAPVKNGRQPARGGFAGWWW